MQSVMLAVDAGGTNFKYGLMTRGCDMVSPCLQIAVQAEGSARQIEDSWRQLSKNAREIAQTMGATIGRVCVSTPGPFDFTAGMSRMKHKFPAIYGMPIRPWIQGELGDVPVDFLHDSTAFLLGELRKGMVDPACVMLGTGFGFACMKNGKVLVDATRTPAVVLWNRPFRAGTVEDYISRRALRASYAKKAGTDGSDDVKEIAQKARLGDRAAAQVFDDLADDLAELLGDVLSRLGSGSLILGGQISLASDLFAPRLQAQLACPVVLSTHPDAAALIGCARFGVVGGAQAAEARQDSSPLAPEQA